MTPPHKENTMTFTMLLGAAAVIIIGLVIAFVMNNR